MALPHAAPGEVIDVRPLGPKLGETKSATLFKTGQLELVRIVMAAGKEISTHEAPGEIVVHCLEGKIVFSALGKKQELDAGKLLYLSGEEPHAVRCVEDASFLLMILLNR